MKHSADDITHANQAKYIVSRVPGRDAQLSKMEALGAHSPIRIVEVGTNIGYGAIVMARAGAHVSVTTIEKSHELCELARGFAKGSLRRSSAMASR